MPQLSSSNILLDLGGVVFQSTGRTSNLIDWKVISALNQKYGHQLNIGEDLFPTFLAEYNQQHQSHLSGPEFLKEIFDTLNINQELIDFLQTQGPIYLLSDNYRENIEYISERYRFTDWSEGQFYSYQYGITKADKTLFKTVIETLGKPAEEFIFIDDDQKNVNVAASCGIPGIVFKNNQQLMQRFLSKD